METKKLTLDAVKKMGLEELNKVMNDSKNLNAAIKQAIKTRINLLSTPAATTPATAPIESLKETIATDAVTGTPAPEVAEPVVVAKVEKNKTGETTRTIEKFDDDTKGIRAGQVVTFLEKGTNKVLTGTVQRLFDFYGNRNNRQEAKIMVGTKPNQTRHYRFEKDITPVAPVVITPEPTEHPVEDVVAEVVESTIL